MGANADQQRTKALNEARKNAITSKQREIAEKKEDLADRKNSKDEHKNKAAFTKSQQDMVNEQRDKFKVSMQKKKEKIAAGLLQNTMKEKSKLQAVDDSEDPAAAKEAKRKEDARKSEEHELRLIETERERARDRLKKQLSSTDKEILKLNEEKEVLKHKLGMSAQLNKLKDMVAKYKQKMKHHTTPRMSPLVPGVH